jgi:hypothetical protein
MPELPPATRAQPSRYLSRRASVTVFLAIFVLYGASVVGGMNTGDLVNFGLTRALVERHTIYLDGFDIAPPDQDHQLRHPYTDYIDYAVSWNGRMVADREPGLSVLAVPFFVLGQGLDGVTTLPYGDPARGATAESKLQMWSYLSVVFLVALGFVLLLHLCARLHAPRTACLLTVVVTAGGTLMWKYSTSFSRHPVVGVCLAVAALAIFLYYRTTPRTGQYLTLAGLALGVASLTDYLAWIPSCLVFVMLLTLERRLTTGAMFLAGYMPWLSVALAYNYAAFGTLLTSPHAHEGYFRYMRVVENNFKTPLSWGLWLNLFSSGPIPAEAISWALDNREVNYQIKAYEATVRTYKGLIIQSPVLVFAAWGWVMYGKRVGLRARQIYYPLGMVLCLLIPMSLLTQFWAPHIYDTRHLVAIVPLSMLGLTFGWSITRHILARVALSATIVVSLFFGLESLVSNFGPNFAIEPRYSMAQLVAQLLAERDLAGAVLNVFPNLYNVHLLFIVGSVLYVVAVDPLLRFVERLDCAER